MLAGATVRVQHRPNAGFRRVEAIATRNPLSATILGTLAAFALVRHDFVGRTSTNVLIFLPMAAPEIVMGSSLLALFVAAGLAGQLGFWTILIAHIMFCLSFVVVTVRARLAGAQ
jgi:spermidine/putrescine transport system permease protein